MTGWEHLLLLSTPFTHPTPQLKLDLHDALRSAFLEIVQVSRGIRTLWKQSRSHRTTFRRKGEQPIGVPRSLGKEEAP